MPVMFMNRPSLVRNGTKENGFPKATGAWYMLPLIVGMKVKPSATGSSGGTAPTASRCCMIGARIGLTL